MTGPLVAAREKTIRIGGCEEVSDCVGPGVCGSEAVGINCRSLVSVIDCGGGVTSVSRGGECGVPS